MLYVRISWPPMLRWRVVWGAQCGESTWTYIAWSEDIVEFWPMRVDVWSEKGIHAYLATVLNPQPTPIAAPSNVMMYGYGLSLRLLIKCPTAEHKYYDYADWLSRRGIYSIRRPLYTPYNGYDSSNCSINNETLSLEPPRSLHTIVPTQLSSLI